MQAAIRGMSERGCTVSVCEPGGPIRDSGRHLSIPTTSPTQPIRTSARPTNMAGRLFVRVGTGAIATVLGPCLLPIDPVERGVRGGDAGGTGFIGDHEIPAAAVLEDFEAFRGEVVLRHDHVDEGHIEGVADVEDGDGALGGTFEPDEGVSAARGL